MTQATQFFCVGHYADADGTTRHVPVHLDAKTMAEAQAALRWQNTGDYWHGAIYAPIPEKPGFMRIASVHRSAVEDHPAEVQLSGPGGWTGEAWASFVARTWREV